MLSKSKHLQGHATLTDPDKAVLVAKTTPNNTTTPATSTDQLPEIISDNSRTDINGSREMMGKRAVSSTRRLSKFVVDTDDSLTDLESLDITEIVPIPKPGESKLITELAMQVEVAQTPGILTTITFVSRC
jgi:hypothetical protein